MPRSMDVNYPDILGGITKGERSNIDHIQCALTTRPNQVAAGQPFEVLLLVQNVTDVDVDLKVELKLPEQDKTNQKGIFFSKSNLLLVGLRPAEVGYVTLPASCSPRTQPGSYLLGVNVKTEIVSKTKTATITLTIKTGSSGKASKTKRVRHEEGGGEYDLQSLPEAIRDTINQLTELNWRFQNKRHQLAAQFEIIPPGLAMPRELKAGWTSLWTMSDHLDEYLLEEHILESYQLIRRGFTVDRILKPIQEATLRYFKDAGYPLKSAEATFIAKAMTYMLCKVTPKHANEIDPRPPWPEWYKHLVRVLFQVEKLREYPIKVATEVIYFSLLKDAVLLCFDLLDKNMQENFGTPDELHDYANTIIGCLEQKEGLAFGKVYLPLILGSLFLNREVTEQGENLRDNLLAIESAYNSRQSEKTQDNEFVFEIFHNSMEKLLDEFRWIP